MSFIVKLMAKSNRVAKLQKTKLKKPPKEHNLKTREFTQETQQGSINLTNNTGETVKIELKYSHTPVHRQANQGNKTQLGK